MRSHHRDQSLTEELVAEAEMKRPRKLASNTGKSLAVSFSITRVVCSMSCAERRFRDDLFCTTSAMWPSPDPMPPPTTEGACPLSSFIGPTEFRVQHRDPPLWSLHPRFHH
jgi:hypothetical protein